MLRICALCHSVAMDEVMSCSDCGYQYTDERYHMLSGCLRDARANAA